MPLIVDILECLPTDNNVHICDAFYHSTGTLSVNGASPTSYSSISLYNEINFTN